MAIQHRRGIYDRFDPTRLVAGEWAVVLSDDPSAKDGRAAYVCFGAGLVKRVATYEDMNDWLLSLKEETIQDVIREGMEGIVADYGELRGIVVDHEAARVLAESLRAIAEEARENAETLRAAAEEERNSAEVERRAFAEDLEQKLDNGELNGATFTPTLDEAGNLTWDNDKGLENPTPVNIKGERGNDGAVIDMQSGLYGFQIVNGHLILVCNDRETVPEFKIENGHLYVKVG